MSSSPSCLDPVVIPLLVGETVLDVGCGYGRWANLIRSNYWESQMKKRPDIDGVDAFQPNVDFCSQSKSYRRVWKQEMPTPLRGKWDTVLACEVIEHVRQELVEETITTLENASGKRIIFSTPNWPYFRGASGEGPGRNDFEAHLSYVSRSFFRNRGYKLIGCGFGNPCNLVTRVVSRVLRGIKAQRVLSSLESVPRVMPWLGTCIVAYKDVH